MTLRDLVTDLPPASAAAAPDDRAAFARVVVRARVGPALASAFTDSIADRLLETPMAGRLDATPVSGHFPVVLLAPGSPFTMPVAAELLASRGFVVIGTDRKDEHSVQSLAFTPNPQSVAAEAGDLAFALGVARGMSTVDASRVGVVGYSSSGIGNLLFAVRSRAPRAIAVFDGWEGRSIGGDILSNVRELDPFVLRGGYLDIESSDPMAGGEPVGAFIDSARRAARWRVRFDGSRHADFATFGVASRAAPPELKANFSRAQRLLAAFMVEQLGGERDFASLLDSWRDTAGIHIVAAPAQTTRPTNDEFFHLAEMNAAAADSLATRLLREDPTHLPYTEQSLTRLATILESRRPASARIIRAIVARSFHRPTEQSSIQARSQLARPLHQGMPAGNMYRGSFTSDGNTLYFFRRTSARGEQYEIVESHRVNGRWSPPARVDLGGHFSDLYPTVSADGRRLVFSSYRPFPGHAATANASLWETTRQRGTWSQPRPLRASRDSAYNAGPELRPDGSVWFTAVPESGASREFLISRDSSVETNELVRQWQTWSDAHFVWSGSPTPDGRTIVLTVSSIDPATRRSLPSDLYVTQRSGDRWTSPRKLGGVNTAGTDNFPWFTPDGRELYFVRDFEQVWHVPLRDALRDTLPADSAKAVPFDFEDARVYVPVSMSDGVTRWFILDTGAQPTVIDVGAADSISLVGGDTASRTGAGRGALAERRTGAFSAMLGGVPFAVEQSVVAPLDSLLAPFAGRRNAGIVGSRFFLDHTVTLDFEQRAMFVAPAGSSELAPRAVVVPLAVRNGIPTARASIDLPDGTRRSVSLMIDLGAKATLLLTESFVRQAIPRVASLNPVRATLGAGVGGRTRYDFVRLPRLTLAGGASIQDFVAGLSAEGTLRTANVDGLLGADFLARYRVVFDYAKQRMLLFPRGPAPTPTELDMSGVFIRAEGADLRRFVVDEVGPGSPAERGGVRLGDRILSIDGRDVQRLSLGTVRALLRRGSGQRVVLTVERDGTQRTIAFVLARRV